jgi:hypothetical protein
MERFCNQQFACFRAVSVGGIDQVHTEFDGAPKNFERGLPVSRPTPNPIAGDAHRAKAEPIDREITAQLPSRIHDHGRCGRGVSSEDCARSPCEKRGSACQSRAKKCSARNARLLLRFQRLVGHDAQVRSRKPLSTQARRLAAAEPAVSEAEFLLAALEWQCASVV